MDQGPSKSLQIYMNVTADIFTTDLEKLVRTRL